MTTDRNTGTTPTGAERDPARARRARWGTALTSATGLSVATAGRVTKRSARAMIIPVVCAVALTLLVQPAWSAPEVQSEVTETFSFPGGKKKGSLCDFPVVIKVTSEQKVRTALPSGEVIITGPAVATVVNSETGESVTLNISGPTQFDPATNRVTLSGTNLILGPLGSSGGRTKFLLFTSGTVSFVLGEPIDTQLRGTVTQDVCAELA